MMKEPIIIEAGKSHGQYWQDLWRYRELFYCLAWRDILVRYKQTFLGVAWTVLRPFLIMVVFTLVFGKLAKIPSGDIPYPILVLTGLLPWQFFSNSFSDASNSLLSSSGLLTKVYFPRLIVPATSVIVSLIDFLISCLILLVMLFAYKVTPDWKITLVPAFLLWVFLFALGAGLFISALTVKYRDFRHIVPFVIQFGLYISPVGFSSTIVPEKWKFLFYLNPIAGIVDGFRYAILNQPLVPQGMTISFCTTVFWVVLGLNYFRKVERGLADQI